MRAVLLPLAASAGARRVPRERRVPRRGGRRTAQPPGTCCACPALRRLLLVNWLLSSSWDMHGFVVPVLGHERGISASAIGAILGLFAAAVAAVRLVMPLLAHRLREEQVLAARCCAPPRCSASTRSCTPPG